MSLSEAVKAIQLLKADLTRKQEENSELKAQLEALRGGKDAKESNGDATVPQLEAERRVLKKYAKQAHLEIEQLQQRVRELEAAAAAVPSDRDATVLLESRLAEATSQREQMATERDELRRQFNSLESRRAEEQANAAAEKARFEGRCRQLEESSKADADAERSRLQLLVDSLQEKLRAAQDSSASAASAETSDLQSKLSLLEDANAALQERAAAAEAKAGAAERRANEQAEKTVSEHLAELAEMRNRLKTVTDDLSRERGALESRAVASESEAAARAENVVALERKLRDAARSAEERDAVARAELTRERELVAAAVLEQERLAAAETKAAAAAAEAERAAAKLQADLDSVRQEVVVLRGAAAATATTRASLEETLLVAEGEMQRLRRENEAAATQLAAKDAALQTVQAELRLKEAELQERAAELQARADELASLRAEGESQLTSHSSHGGEFMQHKLTAAAAEGLEAYADAAVALESARADLAAAQDAQNGAADSEHRAALAQLAVMTEALKAAEKRAEEAESALAAAAAEAARPFMNGGAGDEAVAGEVLDEAAAVSAALKAPTTGASADVGEVIARLQAEREAAQREAADLSQQLVAAKREATGVQSRLRIRVDDLQGQLSELREERDSLLLEVARMDAAASNRRAASAAAGDSSGPSALARPAAGTEAAAAAKQQQLKTSGSGAAAPGSNGAFGGFGSMLRNAFVQGLWVDASPSASQRPSLHPKGSPTAAMAAAAAAALDPPPAAPADDDKRQSRSGSNSGGDGGQEERKYADVPLREAEGASSSGATAAAASAGEGNGTGQAADALLSSVPARAPRPGDWVEELEEHPVPKVGLDSPVIQYLLHAWSSEPEKFKYLSTWLRCVIEKGPVPEGFPAGMQLISLAPEVKDGFLTLVVPLLKSREDAKVRVFSRKMGQGLWDLRIKVTFASSLAGRIEDRLRQMQER